MARPLLQQPLHAGWRFRAADARLGDTEQFTAPDGWYAATVPGTVDQDLIDSGALPDPLVGCQEAAVQWVAERDNRFVPRRLRVTGSGCHRWDHRDLSQYSAGPSGVTCSPPR